MQPPGLLRMRLRPGVHDQELADTVRETKLTCNQQATRVDHVLDYPDHSWKTLISIMTGYI